MVMAPVVRVFVLTPNGRSIIDIAITAAMRPTGLWMIAVLAAAVATCTTQPPTDVDDKLHPDLKAAIERAEQGDDEVATRFAVLVRSRHDPERRRLEEAGLTVETVAGRIVTAVGTTVAIRRAAALESVESISLSQTVDYPLPNDV
jgi:hypothetical protein